MIAFFSLTKYRFICRNLFKVRLHAVFASMDTRVSIQHVWMNRNTHHHIRVAPRLWFCLSCQQLSKKILFVLQTAFVPTNHLKNSETSRPSLFLSMIKFTPYFEENKLIGIERLVHFLLTNTEKERFCGS